ncbi:hypothetical protein M5D96_006930 [Drosophila gunungcola]|uniref:Cathepsin propeptide inhibitor domain-containing protein n=1 Tax=Drosophila gunungcola TaxID=103775 RepID=A0A9P9YMT1_9MUSC|nr:hypothetical protein M5D96_006930 [Drosophila gunungcola]
MKSLRFYKTGIDDVHSVQVVGSGSENGLVQCSDQLCQFCAQGASAGNTDNFDNFLDQTGQAFSEADRTFREGVFAASKNLVYAGNVAFAKGTFSFQLALNAFADLTRSIKWQLLKQNIRACVFTSRVFMTTQPAMTMSYSTRSWSWATDRSMAWITGSSRTPETIPGATVATFDCCVAKTYATLPQVLLLFSFSRLIISTYCIPYMCKRKF